MRPLDLGPSRTVTAAGTDHERGAGGPAQRIDAATGSRAPPCGEVNPRRSIRRTQAEERCQMRYRLVFFTGLGIGFVLGAKAGRERYEQLRKAARKAWDSPAVQQAA